MDDRLKQQVPRGTLPQPGSNRLLLRSAYDGRPYFSVPSGIARIHTCSSASGHGPRNSGAQGVPAIVGGPDEPTQENKMSMLKSILKTAVAAKVVQTVSRELSKPENQRKLKEGLSKLAKQRRR